MTSPIPVIYDTDIWSDVDDALALSMVHTLCDRGVFELVAVTITTGLGECAAYVDVLNTHRGRPGIPIGVVRNGVDDVVFAEKASGATLPNGSYAEIVANRRKPDGSFAHPHEVTGRDELPDATDVLRATLAAQPDGSVVVMQVGFSTNLARLLDSPPDAESPLTGRELVERKVRLLCVMAGEFGGAGGGEYNVAMDEESAARLFSGWPTDVVVSGVEIGARIRMSWERLEADLAEGDPVLEACRAHHIRSEVPGQEPQDHRWPFDNGTCDLTTVLDAGYPGQYFDLSDPGTVRPIPGGRTAFDPSPDGRHRYLVLTDDMIAPALDAMYELVAGHRR